MPRTKPGEGLAHIVLSVKGQKTRREIVGLIDEAQAMTILNLVHATPERFKRLKAAMDGVK